MLSLLVLLLPFSHFILPAEAYDELYEAVHFLPINPTPVGCDGLSGNFANLDTKMIRPLKPSESVIFTGKVADKPDFMHIDMVVSEPQPAIAMQIFQDFITNSTMYNSSQNRFWDIPEFGGPIFFAGKSYEIKILYTGHVFDVYSGNKKVHTYVMRTPPCTILNFINTGGNHTTNWIGIECS
ncbi:unnamed protein product [Caenorhabditis sp. 36 PRJEB53466]|nr:unnamed protein product [Caenorhabditis sp. 36 PRJEB53466]